MNVSKFFIDRPIFAWVIALIILLGALCLVLWSLRCTKQIDARLRIVESRQRIDIQCLAVQGHTHESRLVHLELRTFANSRDIVKLANKVADDELDPDARKTKESPPPAHLLGICQAIYKKTWNIYRIILLASPLSSL